MKFNIRGIKNKVVLDLGAKDANGVVSLSLVILHLSYYDYVLRCLRSRSLGRRCYCTHERWIFFT